MVGGNEVKKLFNISLDVNRSISNREFTVVEGDTGNLLHISLGDDGRAVDLTGCRVMAIFSKSDGTTVSQDSGAPDSGITIGGSANNEITVALSPASVAPGIVECEVQIYSGEEYKTLITSAKFNFKCRRGIFNGDTVESVPQYPLLTGLIATVSGLEATALGLVESNALIQSDEILRQSAESARAYAEGERALAEESRALAENGRAALAAHLETSLAAATGLIAALERTLENCAALPAVDSTATLGTAWLGSTAPYSQSVAVEGLSEGANISVGLAPTATAEQLAVAQRAGLWCTGFSQTHINLVALYEKPCIGLPILVRIMGKNGGDNT